VENIKFKMLLVIIEEVGGRKKGSVEWKETNRERNR
jgi:hypothetical protein